jgi:hypothetical protein
MAKTFKTHEVRNFDGNSLIKYIARPQEDFLFEIRNRTS